MRLCLLLLALLPSFAFSQTMTAEPKSERKPNFIFFLGEGHGWSSSSVVMDGGSPEKLQPAGLTPNLEALSKQGMRFSDFYASCPRCTPSRASFFTGISPAKLHMTYVNEGGSNKREAEKGGQGTLLNRMTTPSPDMELPAGVKTTGDVMRELGYATAHFGKWHAGRIDPTRKGFDVADGANTNQGPDRGSQPNPKQSIEITDKGIAFMREQVKAGKPFFVQMSHYAVGSQADVTPDSWNQTKELLPDLNEKMLAGAAGMRDMDKAIGRVVDALRDMGVANDTYIFFSTDHGTPGGTGGGGGGGGKGPGANAPLFGGKGSVREGGIRVPFLVVGPGVTASTVSRVRGTGMDLLPTMRDLAGSPLPAPTTPDAKNVVEGGSLAKVLKSAGKGTVVRSHPEIVIHFPHYDLGNGGPASAIFVDDHKLIRNYDTKQVMLFDMSDDPGETKDLAAMMPDVVKDLEARLDAYLKAVNAQMPSEAPAAPAPAEKTVTETPAPAPTPAPETPSDINKQPDQKPSKGKNPGKDKKQTPGKQPKNKQPK